MNSDGKMTSLELRSSLTLALIFFLRMTGLFLILPVFVLYAEGLPDATPTLTGIALGCYGLTQAVFQIPFGWMSDRVGRKPVIIAGLLIFAAGSAIAGMADSITTVIIGRALQGSGAIAAAVMALAADLTRDSQRTKAMALIGISVGVAFALAFVAGPLLDPLIGVPGLFYLAGILALLAVIVLKTLVPDPAVETHEDKTGPKISRLGLVLKNHILLMLNVGIFTLHAVLMASFVVIPLVLRDQGGLAPAEHWHVYLPVLLLSGLIMLPFLLLGERLHRVREILTVAILLLAVSQLLFSLDIGGVTALAMVLVLFFTTFNYLEATLPSLVSKTVGHGEKGTALGTFSTSQFLGIFTGGFIGGMLHEHVGIGAVFLFGTTVCLLLFCLALAWPPVEH
ncbi:MAG TPA: MFS transporter [Gammaproteobacteria bacterium]|nr:MFS transporter [Gammaproteobacteria bacterium]